MIAFLARNWLILAFLAVMLVSHLGMHRSGHGQGGGCHGAAGAKASDSTHHLDTADADHQHADGTGGSARQSSGVVEHPGQG